MALPVYVVVDNGIGLCLREGIGITHMSAGSVIQPGGYTIRYDETNGQFHLLDDRPLRRVAREAERLGYKSIYA